MSATKLSSDLFAAAREDAPPGDVRDQVWGRVVAATAVPAVATATSKTAAAPAATAKLLAVGAVIGAASSAVLAFALSSFADDLPAANNTRGIPAVRARGAAAGARLAETSPRGRAEPSQPIEVAATPSAAILAGPHDEASALAEEARIVTEARMALVGHDPRRALELIRRTRNLAVRALEPEELGLEARALRALGNTDEALGTELLLRGRFPEHALSR